MQDLRIYYPELYISSDIQSILNKTPLLPQEPVAPQKPIEPKNPGEYDRGGNRGCAVVLVVVFIILFIVAITDSDVKFKLVLGSVVGILLAFLMFKIEAWEKDSHNLKKEEYKDALRQYPYLFQKYEKELAEYAKKKQIYDTQKTILLSTNNIAKYRANMIRYYLSQSYVVPSFSGCDDSDIVKRGASENFFIEQLEVSTQWKIFTGKKVPVGTKFFYPDIIIEANGIFIDIEIDEPYIGSDGTPIHYMENVIFGKSIDRDRNDYMTKHGWVVIRFSEEQIFLHTNQCIEYIDNVVNSLLEGTKYIETSKQFMKEKWDINQSHKMAYKRFRKTYVPREYASNIDKEDYRSYSEIREEIYW